MVTLQTADNALKTFYLDAITEEIDSKVSPFLSMIEKTSAYVSGKGVAKTVRVYNKGGIGAGSETGTLPTARENQYVTLNATLKNLYGTIEISDKAIRASANSEGAFVNLLNDEMQALVASAKQNFSRMLFGDGSGVVAKLADGYRTSINFLYDEGIRVGLKYDIVSASGEVLVPELTVLSIDRTDNSAVISEFEGMEDFYFMNTYLRLSDTVPGTELTGLKAIFGDDPLYGVDREYSLMRPYKIHAGEAITELRIQTAIDAIEGAGGGKVNLIICSRGVRRALIAYCRENQIALPTMTLGSDTTALSFNGIPIIVDDYCQKGTMYLLNTNYFKLCQLCDWQWMEGESGKILKQVPGTPVYSATLVKYAELLCEKPCAQGMISGIVEA